MKCIIFHNSDIRALCTPINWLAVMLNVLVSEIISNVVQVAFAGIDETAAVGTAKSLFNESLECFSEFAGVFHLWLVLGVDIFCGCRMYSKGYRMYSKGIFRGTRFNFFYSCPGVFEGVLS